jgi:hypothetical protein
MSTKESTYLNNKTKNRAMRTTKKIIIWVCLLAIAFGFLESAVVIYLRELFYKEGFEFPLKPVPVSIARIEFFRELATLIMLIACGIIAGRNRTERFAYFILAFAVWDIFYYIFLYVCVGWPLSLSTWDILFLIPVPWVSPVWAPCLLCLLMITGSLFTIIRTDKFPDLHISVTYWWSTIAGAFICIVAFMWDYLLYTYSLNKTWWVFSSSDLFSDMTTYIPQQFNSPLFFTGFITMCVPLSLFIFKSIKHENQ